MTFTQKFDAYICIGDTITCTVDGYTVTARIAHDETPDAPDQRQDGFWPSLYPNDAGFIGAGNGWRDCFDAAQAKAEKRKIPRQMAGVLALRVLKLHP